MTIGQSIRQQRKKNGMTQQALAKRIGILQCHISWWETERCYPSIVLATCLADVFGITLDELVGRRITK